MARRWSAYGGLVPLGLALGAMALAKDDSKAKNEAAIKARNEAIQRKLDKPIPLRLKNLPLGALFDHVKKATTESGDSGVPIAVDPGALAKAEVTLATPVTYESNENDSLMASLHTVLGRMNLRPRVEQGSLKISWTMYRLIERDPETKRVRDRLEEKVDLSFEKQSLENVLKFIKFATRKGPDDKGLTIYVDPLGLQEAERTLATPVSFRAHGEPLKSSLGRLLKSIGLTYQVKDAYLMVTPPE